MAAHAFFRFSKIRSEGAKNGPSHSLALANSPTGNPNLDLIQGSEKFRGIINFVASTLNPVYHKPIVKVARKMSNGVVTEEKVSSHLREEDLKTVISRLTGLKTFLESHASASLEECPMARAGGTSVNRSRYRYSERDLSPHSPFLAAISKNV